MNVLFSDLQVWAFAIEYAFIADAALQLEGEGSGDAGCAGWQGKLLR